MAFAAARMIMPKDKQQRKPSSELPGVPRNRREFPVEEDEGEGGDAEEG